MGVKLIAQHCEVDMRITKSGKRNKQDWDIKDHIAAGHAPTLPPLTLAVTNISTSAANLESAAKALKSAEERVIAAQVAQIVKTLDGIMSILKTKEAK